MVQAFLLAVILSTDSIPQFPHYEELISNHHGGTKTFDEELYLYKQRFIKD
jgi:hypothetical protein